MGDMIETADAKETKDTKKCRRRGGMPEMAEMSVEIDAP